MRIVDLRQERRKEKSATILSEKLRAAIADRLEKREQTILFLNRRGFSTSLLCSDCGEARNCPNCSVALTFHRHPAVAGRLSCHLCGHTAAVPKKCPACGKDALIYAGFGTEKVESTVSQIFPKAVVRRMDADSMTRKEAYRETLRNFRTGKIDILVGTQMIAKGLAFSKCDAGRNHQRRSRPASARFSRRRTHVSASHTGRRTRRTRRNIGRSLCANLHAVQSVDPVCAAPRFRRLLSTGARISGALRFSTIQTRRPDHGALCARRTRKIVGGNITAPLERSAAAGIHFGRRDPRAARKITRPIPLPHPGSWRSHHASEPPRPRNRSTNCPSPKTSQSPSTSILISCCNLGNDATSCGVENDLKVSFGIPKIRTPQLR